MKIREISTSLPGIDYGALDLYRSTFRGGTDFVGRYLKHFSHREDHTDFERRRRLTYCPAMAKAALLEVMNTLIQRLQNVTRVGGSESYKSATKGDLLGVDRFGHSMLGFLSKYVLPELTVTSKVGVYVDREPIGRETLAVSKTKRPYVYIYKVEDIISCTYDTRNELTAVLLRQDVADIDETTGLEVDTHEEYQLLRKTPEGILVNRYDSGDVDTATPTETVLLKLKQIPFKIFSLQDSLMRDIASYQVALLNMNSSDIAFLIDANFSVYTEQGNPIADAIGKALQGNIPQVPPVEGEHEHSGNHRRREQEDVIIGNRRGRRYAKNTDRPGFIAPPVDPLRVSIEKEEQMKKEIRMLLHLSINALTATRESADAKREGQSSSENGLACIGLELCKCEQFIASIWHAYEGTNDTVSIIYPTDYCLKSQGEIDAEVALLVAEIKSTPSIAYKRELSKRKASLMLGPTVSANVLTSVLAEIDKAEYFDCDYKAVASDIEAGILGSKTGAKIRGYSEEEAELAQSERIERLTSVALAQSKAVPGATEDAEQARLAKEKSQNPDGSGKTRGDGK